MSSTGSLQELQTTVAPSQHVLELEQILIQLLMDRNCTAGDGNRGAAAAVTYNRWGRTTCPDDTGATLVYEGECVRNRP